MYSIILKARASLLTAVFLTIAAGFLAPMALADNHGPLQPTDAPTALPTYSGVDESIEAFLCTPKGQGTDLLDCVGRLYRFGISAGAIALIFFLVLAGYLYITSGEAGKGKAKNILLSAVTGMGILLGSFVLLNFINPTLTQIRPIQPPIFQTADLPSCEQIGFSARCIISTGPSAGQVSSGQAGPRGKACSLMTGNCSTQNLQAAGCSAQLAKGMSILCSVESANDPTIYSRSDICEGPNGKRSITLSNNPGLPANVRGKTIPMSASWGLFQFNLTFHRVGGHNCPAAFGGTTFTGSNKSCNVSNQSLYESCIIAATTVQSHLQYACQLAGRRQYRDWQCSAWKCGLSNDPSNCASAYGIRQIVPFQNPLLN